MPRFTVGALAWYVWSVSQEVSGVIGGVLQWGHRDFGLRVRSFCSGEQGLQPFVVSEGVESLIHPIAEDLEVVGDRSSP